MTPLDIFKCVKLTHILSMSEYFVMGLLGLYLDRLLITDMKLNADIDEMNVFALLRE